MRTLALALCLAAGVVAQEPTSKPSDLEQLQQEVVRLKRELEQLREVNRIKDELRKVKRALAEERLPPKEREKLEAKRRLAEKRKQPKPAAAKKKQPKGWVFLPARMPVLAPGECKILKDVKGTWWIVRREKWGGCYVCLNEFGAKAESKAKAEEWVKLLRYEGWVKQP